MTSVSQFTLGPAPPPPVPEKNLYGLVEQCFYGTDVLSVTQLIDWAKPLRPIRHKVISEMFYLANLLAQYWRN